MHPSLPSHHHDGRTLARVAVIFPNGLGEELLKSTLSEVTTWRVLLLLLLLLLDTTACDVDSCANAEPYQGCRPFNEDNKEKPFT